MFFYKDLFYKFVFSLFFICIINFSCVEIISAATDDRAGTDKIQVTADTLNVNNEENYAEFIGDVTAIHKDMTIDSDRLQIYYDKTSENNKASAENERSIKKIIAEGAVTIVSEGRIANSEKAEYMIKTGVLVLTGKNASITSNKNSITGDRITFHRSLGNVKVAGDPVNRVRAIFFANKKSSEFNILKSDKADSDMISIKKNSEVKTKSEMETPQAVIAEVVQDQVPEKPVIQEVSAPIVKNEHNELECKQTLQLTEEKNDLEVEDLANENNNSIQLAALTLPDEEKKLATIEIPEEPILVAEEVAAGNLMTKIGIIFVDQKKSFGGNDYNLVLNNYLARFSTEECKGITFLKLSKNDYPNNYPSINNIQSIMATDDPFDNINLLKTSRDLGLNAIVMATISDIFTEKETSGILWFRDNHDVMIVRVMVEVYDTESGAKIFDESFMRKTDIDEAASKIFAAEKKVDQVVLSKLLKKITTEAADKFSDVLTAQHWTGFLKSTDKENIIISSGRNTGLKPGNLLEVYDTKTIKGYHDSKFIIIGNKVGMIQITKVSPDTSQAVLVAGTEIRKGNFLKPKQPVIKR
ncbi:MAG: hypothetical protein J7K84_04480 [Deltaproteobacteria bacterium]|nr:hypothetical protein [Deltaproteobacteria bacterium]